MLCNRISYDTLRALAKALTHGELCCITRVNSSVLANGHRLNPAGLYTGNDIIRPHTGAIKLGNVPLPPPLHLDSDVMLA